MPNPLRTLFTHPRLPLRSDQAWTVERQVREAMKGKGSSPREAAKVAERVRGEQLGVRTDDLARLQAAEAKRARKAGRVVPEGHGGVPVEHSAVQTITRKAATTVAGVRVDKIETFSYTPGVGLEGHERITSVGDGDVAEMAAAERDPGGIDE